MLGFAGQGEVLGWPILRVKNVFFFFLVFLSKEVSLLALVSAFNDRCCLRSRCSMETWCLDDVGRDSWDWDGPPAWETA